MSIEPTTTEPDKGSDPTQPTTPASPWHLFDRSHDDHPWRHQLDELDQSDIPGEAQVTANWRMDHRVAAATEERLTEQDSPFVPNPATAGDFRITQRDYFAHAYCRPASADEPPAYRHPANANNHIPRDLISPNHQLLHLASLNALLRFALSGRANAADLETKLEELLGRTLPKRPTPETVSEIADAADAAGARTVKQLAVEFWPGLAPRPLAAMPDLPEELAVVWRALSGGEQADLINALNPKDAEAGRKILNRLAFAPPKLADLAAQEIRSRLARLSHTLFPSDDQAADLTQLEETQQAHREKPQHPRRGHKHVDRQAEKNRAERSLQTIQQCLENGSYDKARRFLDELVAQQDQQGLADTDQHIAKTLTNAATLARDAGLLEWAEELLHAARDRNPDDEVAASGLADVLKARGELGAAEQQYRHNIARWPNNEVAANGLAEVLKARGELDAAERQYRDNIARWPHDGVARNGLANVLRKQARHDEALQLLPALDTSTTPRDFYDLHLRAMILMESGDIPTAETLFERGMREARLPTQRSAFRRGLMLIRLAKRDFHAVSRDLQTLPTDVPHLDIYRLHAAAGQGDLPSVREFLNRSQINLERMDPTARQALQTLKTGFCLTEGNSICQPDEAAYRAILSAEIDMEQATEHWPGFDLWHGQSSSSANSASPH